MTTREQILELLRVGPRTPLDLVRELEKHRDTRDARSTLLRLITDGTVDFDIDGKIRVANEQRIQPTAVTA